MEWKSKKRRPDDELPESYEIDTEAIRISIHHYIGCGETWFISCYDLSVKCHQLKSKGHESAKKEALVKIRAKLNSMIESLK